MTGQTTLRAALLDPDAPAPDGLTDAGGRPAARRFDVYRNNVAASLTEALETGFPVIRRLVGAEFFRAMAGAYLRAHPPATPRLALYGDTFPTFLECFPPVAHLPYLPDVARLEYDLRESYHAADALPIAPAMFAEIPEDRLDGLRLRFGAAVGLVRSAHPIVSIWRANTAGGPAPAPGPESALVTRPGWDPRPHLLPEPAAACLAALMAGARLGAAAEAGGPALDLAALLRLLLRENAITALDED